MFYCVHMISVNFAAILHPLSDFCHVKHVYYHIYRLYIVRNRKGDGRVTKFTNILYSIYVGVSIGTVQLWICLW